MAEDNKKDLNAPDGVRKLLNMDGAPEEAKPQTHPAGSPPANLPFMENIEEPPRNILTKPQIPEHIEQPIGGPAHVGETGPIEQIIAPAERKGHELYSMFLWALKNVGPYVLIFAIGIGLYIFYFSNFSFNSLLNSNSLKIESLNTDNQNKDLEVLEKQQAGDYKNWMQQFFFDVNDDSITSMDADVSGNGLTNFEKYLLNLNPKVFSTRGGMGDGEAVLQDINPWTGKAFTDDQKQLVDKYINKELVSNRITAAALTRGVTKYAQYVSNDSPYYIDPNTLQQAGSGGQTISSPETLNDQQAAQTARTVASANPSPVLDPGSQIDQTIPGHIDIPANKVSVPLTWTQDVKDFDNDLKKGTVHYPGTPLPGEVGTSYISGHSSGYIWDHSPYKQVFAILGQVKDGTSFTITATQKDGKKVIYHYVVDHRGEYAANDQAQFVSTGESIVALSTCWPVGTTDHRLVLFAKLTQVEKQ